MAKRERFYMVSLVGGVHSSSSKNAAKGFFRGIDADKLNRVTVIEGTVTRGHFKAHGKPKFVKIDRESLRTEMPTEIEEVQIEDLAKSLGPAGKMHIGTATD